jgi:putative phosphoribosyl transferase
MFADRKDAARQLAEVLSTNKHVKGTNSAKLIVLSIPRGGVVIGAEIAAALGCAHDVLVAKKIGFPGHKELAIGAVAEDGFAILDERIDDDWLSSEDIEIATEEAQMQVDAYIHARKRRSHLR